MGLLPLQASSSALAAYAALGGAAGAAEAVCDRCLQPVDGAAYAANLERLRGDEAAAATARSEAEQRVVASQVAALACRLSHMAHLLVHFSAASCMACLGWSLEI